MSPHGTYPADAGSDVYLLTVLGTPKAGVTSARDLHNATAGAPASVAGARALGDLSHNVFLPAEHDHGQLLFIDTWNSPSGVGQFFGNPQVQQAAGHLFAERDATLWAPAAGFGSYAMPAPSGRSVSGVGLIRVPVTSVAAARAAFSSYAAAAINGARLSGQVAHQVWSPAPVPGTEPAVEVLGVDYWLDVDQMIKYYTDLTLLSTLGEVFAGEPMTGTWKSAGSDWIEW